MVTAITHQKLAKMQKIADGGEASIYQYGTDKVLKIFHPQTRIADKEAKVKALLTSGLRGQQLVLPTEIIEVNKKFAGYAMPRIDGANPLHDFTKARFVKTEQLNNLDTLEIISSIGRVLDGLHGRNVVVGDVSDNNFMASAKSPHAVYFIDLDSWGIGNLAPDAFTETFVPPESYSKTRMKLDAKTDNFGYAILAFLVLTRLHPFNGTYTKNDKLSVTERIKQGLSVLGKAKDDIIINKAIPAWTWMSPDLLDGFLKVFEGGVRDTITPLLDDQLKHSKKCPVHGIYYYDRFADCPLCSGQAKIVVIPVPTVTTAKPAGTGPRLAVIFTSDNVRLMLDAESYIATDGEVIYRPTGRRVDFAHCKTHFAAQGKFAIGIDNNTIRVRDANDNEVAKIPRAHASSYALSGINLLYVDQNDAVRQLSMTAVGLSDGAIQQSHNPLLAINTKGDYFILARYADRLLATYGGRDIEIRYADKITEWTIKYDEKTDTWVLIFELPNGKHRSLVFGKNGLEYDSDVVRYEATPLSNICYYGGTVYSPGNGEIIGANLVKNTTKKFPCAVVDASSALEFSKNGFTIINDDKIYRFG